MTTPREYSSDRPFYRADWHYYYPAIVDIVPAGASVLDVGCGNGDLMSTLVDKGCHVIGVDISLEAAISVRDRGLDCLVGNIEDGIPSELTDYQFDYVIMAASLEHVLDPRAVLLHLRNHTNNILIAVPNFSFILWRWYYLRGKNAKKFNYPTETTKFHGVQTDGHIQFFNTPTLDQLLRATGYEPRSWAFLRSPATRSVNPNNFDGPCKLLRWAIHNYLFVPTYNHWPVNDLCSNLIIVHGVVV